MKINFERTGGFAGMRMTAVLDTGSMPGEDARYLQEIVDASDFFHLPVALPIPEKGADYFQYKLTVESEGKKHTVELSEVSVPEKLRPLIDLCMKEVHRTRS